MSNIATLRHGQECETMRLFLRWPLPWEQSDLCALGVAGLGPPRALFEGRRRGDPLRGRPARGRVEPAPFGLCPTSTGWSPVAMARAQLLAAARRGQTPGRGPRDDDDDARCPKALKDPKQVSGLAAIAPRPGCDLQRPQGEGRNCAGGGGRPVDLSSVPR